MDHTTENTARLFDEVLEVLGRHYREKGAEEAFEYLKAAKFNYIQGDIEHMMSSLVLALDQLAVHPPSEGFRDALRSAIHGFVQGISESASRMAELARQYEAGGGKLLSREEILEEVHNRRGSS